MDGPYHALVVGDFNVDEGEGTPSRWITLRALQVLDWYETRREA